METPVLANTFLEHAALAAFWIMSLSLFFPLFRLFKGPTLPDRIVALDQIAVIVVGIILCEIIYTRNEMLLDAVLVISFLLVFGAIIIARYLFKKQKDND